MSTSTASSFQRTCLQLCPNWVYALTINPWHHIQTAWWCKFKCAVEDVVEWDEMEDAEALQAGHMRATENIYGLSTHSRAGAVEDFLPSFLKASTSWQENCQVPLAGQLPSFHSIRQGNSQTICFHPQKMQHIINLDHHCLVDLPFPMNIENRSDSWQGCALQGQTDVIAILPTGEAKSMLATHCIQSTRGYKTAILVLPLNSLIMEIERRLQAMHVPHQVYIHAKCRHQYQRDKSQTAQWRNALANHARHKTIACIVVYGTHIPTDNQRLSQVIAVPLILLIAILSSPSFLPILKVTYLLVFNASIYRQGPNWPELKFKLEKPQ